MVRSALVLAAGVLVIAVWSSGPLWAGDGQCAMCCAAEKAVAANPEVKEHKVTDQEVGTETVCPVMGAKFKADPEKYVKAEKAQ